MHIYSLTEANKNIFKTDDIGTLIGVEDSHHNRIILKEEDGKLEVHLPLRLDMESDGTSMVVKIGDKQ